MNFFLLLGNWVTGKAWDTWHPIPGNPFCFLVAGLGTDCWEQGRPVCLFLQSPLPLTALPSWFVLSPWSQACNAFTAQQTGPGKQPGNGARECCEMTLDKPVSCPMLCRNASDGSAVPHCLSSSSGGWQQAGSVHDPHGQPCLPPTALWNNWESWSLCSGEQLLLLALLRASGWTLSHLKSQALVQCKNYFL